MKNTSVCINTILSASMFLICGNAQADDCSTQNPKETLCFTINNQQSAPLNSGPLGEITVQPASFQIMDCNPKSSDHLTLNPHFPQLDNPDVDTVGTFTVYNQNQQCFTTPKIKGNFLIKTVDVTSNFCQIDFSCKYADNVNNTFYDCTVQSNNQSCSVTGDGKFNWEIKVNHLE